MKRIAVIQYAWGLQGYSRDFVVGLADHGYVVDFFIDAMSLDSGLVDPVSLAHPRVNVHRLQGYLPPGKALSARIPRRLRSEVLMLANSLFWLVTFRDYRRVLSYLRQHITDIEDVVGIEKVGFLLAAVVGKRLHVPYVYYSLELYFRDRSSNRYYQKMLTLEARYHKTAKATIIQDRLRRDALYAHNSVSGQPHVYFPVSVKQSTMQSAVSYWHERFGLGDWQRVILYFGNLDINLRRLDSLVRAWRDCPGHCVLVFHGSGQGSELRALCDAEGLPNIFISATLVPEENIPMLVGSADIGVCVYDNNRLNDRLTAFSSQKIALFMREGVPIISSGNESYDALYSAFRCGEIIDSDGGFSGAITKILNEQEIYREQARKAYERFFSFERNFDAIVNFLISNRGRLTRWA